MTDAKKATKLENISALPGGLIALSEWKQPTASARGTLRDAFSKAWRFLKRGMRPDENRLDETNEAASLTEQELARYAPVPGWASRSVRLGEALDNIQCDTAVKVIVAAPYSGLIEPLELLAKSRGRRVITPPEELLMNQQDAADWWAKQDLDTPWILPDLARFWLRHRIGLELVRELFTRLTCDELGQGVIGCSSWCWEFWMRYMPELAISPLTLAPLYDDELARWFTALPLGQLNHPLSVRMAHNGDWAIMPADADGDSGKHSTFMKDLAAMARGNSGVALAIWRVALQARPEAESDEAHEDIAETVTEREYCDCWVLPLEQLKLPAVPNNSSKKLTHVLHALLLHTVLSEHRLVITTGLSQHDVGVCLHALKRAELVMKEGSGWLVTALGYPAIREHLQRDGYPMDRF